MTNFWVIEQDKKALLPIMASLIAMTGAARSLPLAGRVAAKPPGGDQERSAQRTKSQQFGFSSDERPEPEQRAGGSAPTPSVANECARRPELLAERSARTSLPRYLYRTVLKILRPAEWAARRLVIAFSSSIRLPPPKPRPQKPLPIVRDGFGNPMLLPDGLRMSVHLFRTKPIRKSGSSGAPKKLTLPLFDPLPKFATKPFAMRRAAGVPRIAIPDGGYSRQPIPPKPGRTDPIDATRVTLRIGAIMAALDDIPGHALRYARWRDRIRLTLPSGGKSCRSCALKPGRLPGADSKVTREVYGVLEHIHQFAWYAVNYPDDS